MKTDTRPYSDQNPCWGVFFQGTMESRQTPALRMDFATSLPDAHRINKETHEITRPGAEAWLGCRAS
jgi:hypothetical protein